MIGLLLALTAATFAADRLIPLGIVVWVLYLVPLVLTTQLLPQFAGMALARSNELLPAAQRTTTRAQRLAAIGQFTATIAHKIGTPLTALSGYMQLLMEDLLLPPKVRGRLQTVEAQIERTRRTSFKTYCSIRGGFRHSGNWSTSINACKTT